jgi:succinate-acetate transporter protein
MNTLRNCILSLSVIIMVLCAMMTDFKLAAIILFGDLVISFILLTILDRCEEQERNKKLFSKKE